MNYQEGRVSAGANKESETTVIENLITACGQLRVSAAAAEVFSRNAERLASLVSAELETDPRAASLMGATPCTSMRESHNNRAELLKFVFRQNEWELLTRTVCWEYRALHARGVSYDYFVLEFAAWQRAVQSERSCSQEISAIFAWLIDHHQSVIKLSQVGEGLESPIACRLNSEQEDFVTLLLRGDSREAMARAQRAVGTVPELKRFYVTVVCPALHRIGMLWETNEISVAEEHLSTAIVGRIITALYLGLSQPTRVPERVALVAAGPYELHEVGARMMADYLELAGWTVPFLGGNLSVTELVSVAKQLRPFLISLSVSSVYNLDATRRLAHVLKSDPQTRTVRLMLGGYVFNRLPGLRRHFAADAYLKELDEGVLSANAWWEQRSP